MAGLTRSQAAGECDECDSRTDNDVVNGCLLCDRCAAMLPDPAGLCHGSDVPDLERAETADLDG